MELVLADERVEAEATVEAAEVGAAAEEAEEVSAPLPKRRAHSSALRSAFDVTRTTPEPVVAGLEVPTEAEPEAVADRGGRRGGGGRGRDQVSARQRFQTKAWTRARSSGGGDKGRCRCRCHRRSRSSGRRAGAAADDEDADEEAEEVVVLRDEGDTAAQRA